MSEITFTEPLHERIAGLVKHLEGEYPPHVLADVSEAAALIEEQAAGIATLEAALKIIAGGDDEGEIMWNGVDWIYPQRTAKEALKEMMKE